MAPPLYQLESLIFLPLSVDAAPMMQGFRCRYGQPRAVAPGLSSDRRATGNRWRARRRGAPLLGCSQSQRTAAGCGLMVMGERPREIGFVDVVADRGLYLVFVGLPFMGQIERMG